MVCTLFCFPCRLELQNLQLTHRAQRAESELSDLRAFLSQLLAAASPPAAKHAAALPSPTSPAAARLTASSKAAASPAFMTQPAAPPASTLLADANPKAAASAAVRGHATAAAAAAPPPSMSHIGGSPHGISQGAAESSGTGQPHMTDTPSVLPASPLKQLQCSGGQVHSLTLQIRSPNGQLMSSNGHVQSLDGHKQSSACPRKPGLPAVDQSVSPSMSNGTPACQTSNGTGLNPALGVDMTKSRSNSAKGSPQQPSDIASQPLETAGHMQSGPTISSGRPAGTMGKSSPPMGTSIPVMGSARLVVGKLSPTVGSASPIMGTPILCKPAGITLQPTGSPSQRKGSLGCLPINSANQLPSLPASSIQPANHSDYSLDRLQPLEHPTAQLQAATQHEEHLVSDDVCDASPVQQAEQAQQPAQAPSVSCNRSMPTRSHGQSGTTDCSPESKQQVNNGTSAPVIDRQLTSATASMEIPASTEGTWATAAAPSEEEPQGAAGVGKQSIAGQQSAGLVGLAAGNTSKHLPAASRPPSPPGNPADGVGPEVGSSVPSVVTALDTADADLLQETDALMHRSVDPSADTMPKSIARVLRHHPHKHTSCTHSLVTEQGRQPAAVAAAGDSDIEAAGTDTLTHTTDTPAESAAAAGELSLAAEDSPSSEGGASQKEVSHTAAELFCMVSDKDSQDVAIGQDIACIPSHGIPTQGFPPQSRSFQVDAPTNQLQHQYAYHDQQLGPAVSLHQPPLTASPQQKKTGHSMSIVAALSLPGLRSHKQDAQGLADAGRPTVDRLDRGEHHGKFTDAFVGAGEAAKPSDADEKENGQAVESAMASGE